MRIIETTSRQFRDKQKDFFDMADNGEKIVIKRGKKQAYVLTPVSDDDLYFSPEMIKRIKDSVKEVRLSQRLTDSPACVVLDEQDLSGAMERLLKASGQAVPTHKPILELNPDHRMIQQLKAQMSGPRFEDWAWILLDQAVLAEGGQLSDPALFVRRFNQLLLDLV